ncbi:unnamed protein product [Eruca vesicaria subsp. sativa]|uniref:Uncharacterized protein n=1 Tax=Eruca vesicaria subsp. sativa TaxID=29727 RepID=A0ABC8LHL8_ERUVS|nr:unnamed protein product [Eruca vesicaria subsp. sativa]
MTKTQGDCFMVAIDTSEITGWPKRSLIEALNEIQMKNLEIKQLKNNITILSSELAKQLLAETHPKQEEEGPVAAHVFNWTDFIFRCFRSN